MSRISIRPPERARAVPLLQRPQLGGDRGGVVEPRRRSRKRRPVDVTEIEALQTISGRVGKRETMEGMRISGCGNRYRLARETLAHDREKAVVHASLQFIEEIDRQTLRRRG